MRPQPAIDALRAQIEKIEGHRRRVQSALPFGLAAVDSRLPGRGLARGALHKIAGGGHGVIDGATAALFAAGIAARTKGRVLWCITQADIFAPAVAQAGLSPDRVVYLEAGDQTSVLACMEEGLRHGGMGAVVGEVAHLSMKASRRLMLAAEGTGTIGLALRRWRRQADSMDFGQPTAAATCWRVSVLPSTPLPAPGVGRARSHLREQPAIQLDLPLGLPDEKHRPGARQGIARWSVDLAMDAVRARFGRDAVGYATAQLDRARSVPDAFRELAEKDLGGRDK